MRGWARDEPWRTVTDTSTAEPRDTSGDLSPDTVIGGKYAVLRRLGGGAMGAVYEARHRVTGARCALKVLHADPSRGPTHLDRFMREAGVAAQVGHEGVVQVLDAGVDEVSGRFWLVMELLVGLDLGQWLERGDGSRLRLLSWARDMLPALEAAHRAGIVHRDLKPENVFVAEVPGGGHRVKILDFGIARPVGQKTSTQTGIAVGTPCYMSPEQALKPSTVDVPSDVWSFGAMLYELTTGAPPFDGESAHAVVLAAASLPHTPMDVVAPEVPTPLARLVDRCLSKEPAARPTASEVLAALDGILGSEVHRGALGERPSMLDGDLRPSLATASTDEARAPSMAFPARSEERPTEPESPTLPAPRADAEVPHRRRAIAVGAALGLALVGLVALALRGTQAPSIDATPPGARAPLERSALPGAQAPVAAEAPRVPSAARPADPGPSPATAPPRAPAPTIATPRAEVPGGPATGVRPRPSSLRPDEARPAPGTMDEPLAPSTAPAPTAAPEPTSAPPAREDVRPQTASSAGASTAATGTPAGTAPAVPTRSGSAPPPSSTPTPRRPGVPARPATPATPPPFTF